jgi:tetratricopeptide (TPR) repeat protein
MQKPHRPANERGELMRQLAGVIHEAESGIAEHHPENARAIITNLRNAERDGVTLSAADWVNLGDAHQWRGSAAEAADAYRQALRLAPGQADRLRRKIVELDLSRAGRSPSGEDLALVEQILASSDAGAGDYYWAVGQEVDWLLEKSEWRKAHAIVEDARERLEGAEEHIALPYLEARCLVQGGRGGQAEAILRKLRDAWTTHDDLWAKAGVLLGRIEQDCERPQMALASYEEVLKSFCTPDLKDACELGRAECLAALGQNEEALKQFQELSDRIMSPSPHPSLDRDAIRATVGSIGESLLANRIFTPGAAFVELAMKWAPDDRTAERVHFASRLADTYAEMARKSGTSADEARNLFARSAEMNLLVSQLSDDDEVLAARALDQAVSGLEAASIRPRMNDALKGYAASHSKGLWRSTALCKLGESYQVEHRYREAAAAYDEVLRKYPRMPDALRSMVPLAECLIRMGNQDVGARRRGVDLLLEIVDDRGKEQLFAPSAVEYREALYQLASYLSGAADSELADHLEQAIVRWSDWIALYPDEPRQPEAHFQLADAFRRSGLKLRDEGAAQDTEEKRRVYHAEFQKRITSALTDFENVIAMLAPLNGSGLAATADGFLRASYLYRADCLFDLARYQKALEAYREAAWRYEDQPTAVTASLQVVNCHERLGQLGEAAAALARGRWLLAKVPALAFEQRKGAPSKEYYQAMFDRLERSGLY